ncbi:helix-turn-helix domain-containing protein [Roseibium album]|uniref:helix-turn-helix domain-containing protein n=1 Tax=Roseibium album TaxID=311410 RepID=UPI00249235B5|nr:helix-turn-helix transcriptional regulator [Roseibium album]
MQHPLEAYRTERKRTQKQMAEKIGCAQSTYNAWVKADRFPAPAMLTKIATVTEASVTAADMVAAWNEIRQARGLAA